MSYSGLFLLNRLRTGSGFALPDAWKLGNCAARAGDVWGGCPKPAKGLSPLTPLRFAAVKR